MAPGVIPGIPLNPFDAPPPPPPPPPSPPSPPSPGGGVGEGNTSLRPFGISRLQRLRLVNCFVEVPVKNGRTPSCGRH